MRPALRYIAAATCATALLAGCSGGGNNRRSSAKKRSGPATTAPAPREGERSVKVGKTFQYGGFLVTIGEAGWNTSKRQLAIAVRLHNIGSRWNAPEPAAAVKLGGQEAPLVGTSIRVPPGGSSDLELTADVPEGNPLEDGVVLWGRPDLERPEIALGSSKGHDALFTPAEFTVDAWGRVGKYAVHVTGGHVQAASLDLNQQAPPGQRVVRLVFDEYASRLDPVNGFHPLEHLTLKAADGTIVEGLDASPGRAPVSWTVGGGNWIEFPVAEARPSRLDILLSSLSPKGFSTAHPELVERVAIPVTVGKLRPDRVDEGFPWLPRKAETAKDTPGGLVERDLAGPAVNVAGFSLRPQHLTWDPTQGKVKLAAEAVYLQTESRSNERDLTNGALDAPPQFSFTAALASGGGLYAGAVTEGISVPASGKGPVVLEFDAVDRLDPDDVGLYIGPDSSQASSVPLTRKSNVLAYPPAPSNDRIEAEPVTASDWTVKLRSFRVGLLRTTDVPAPGQLDLEITMDVTASPRAVVRSLGLSFRASVQLFMSMPNGYMRQPVGDSGLVFYKPGQTQRQTVTFHVPDAFAAGRYGFVLRGWDESADVTIDSSVETTFGARLGSPPSGV